MSELIIFLSVRRLWWMIPKVIVLLVLGSLILFTQSGALAPFLYPLFFPPQLYRLSPHTRNCHGSLQQCRVGRDFLPKGPILVHFVLAIQARCRGS